MIIVMMLTTMGEVMEEVLLAETLVIEEIEVAPALPTMIGPDHIYTVIGYLMTLLVTAVLIILSGWATGAFSFDPSVIEEDTNEILERAKSSRHSRLVLPPHVVKSSSSKDFPPKPPNSNKGMIPATASPVQEKTKQLMKKMYSAAIGETNRARSLTWAIDSHSLTEGSVPILCFVNSKSGGKQGQYFKYELKRLLNPIQVFDLSEIDASVPLRAFSVCPRFRVLVAGGDGTVGWVLDSIDKVENWSYNRPAVALLPIGTGNDLANELGWLSCIRNHALNVILEKIMNAQPVQLDRWQWQQVADNSNGLTRSLHRHSSSPIKQTFQNYCGLGVDAQISLQFHLMRESSPSMFFHRYVNKFWYGIMGWQEIWKSTHETFPQQVSLKCDGVVVEIPGDSQGLVFLNISSYGGGSILWGNECDPQEFATVDDEGDFEEKRWLPVSSSDGIMEVVSIKNSLELAQIKIGICSCLKVAQGKVFEVTLKKPIPIQFDGEPRVQSPGVFSIRASEVQATMLKPVPDDMDLDLVEVLDWAQRQHIITSTQQDLLMEEYVKRVERRRWRSSEW